MKTQQLSRIKLEECIQMGIFKKTMSILVLVFFVASLTAASASAGYWNGDCHNEKCDCYKDRCDCHKDKCGCGCGCKEKKCGCDCDFDFASFFGTGCFNFFGEDEWLDGSWIN